MKTRLKLALLLIPAAALAGWWWHRASVAAASGPLFRTASVTRGDVTATVTATGTIEAVTTVDVGSQVSGNILKLHADYNDAVKAGQLVAEIDPAPYEARVVQAEGSLDGARATLEQKQTAFKRSEKLFQESLLSQSDYESAKADLDVQEANVRIQEAAVQSAKLDLAHTKIYSPIDGVVISRDIDLGQTVQASFSAPELFKIAQDLRQMQISASVSEADIGSVAPEQPVTFTVDAFPERIFSARVKQVRKNATTTSNVVTYTTIISVDNSDLKLLPGMTASVVITTAHRAGVLRLANAALRFSPVAGARIQEASEGPSAGADSPRTGDLAGAAAIVYVVAGRPDADGHAGGALVPTPVRTGLADSAHTEIISGLAEDTTVATGTVATGAAGSTGSGTSPARQTGNPFNPGPPGGGPPPR
ncbi:MAG: efflux RND transporter periplasmic adaptor subunit [Opitutaceae bacterium]|jgi:HlyD family secretion protein